MDALTIALPPSLDAFVQQQVDSGAYGTPHEVIRDALEQLLIKAEQREASVAWLRNAIQEGIDSGPATPLDMAEIIRTARMEFAGIQDAAE